MWARIIAAISLAFTSLFLGVPEPDAIGPKRTVMSERSGTTLRIVGNSDICETTPSIQTISRYIDIGNSQNHVSKPVKSILSSQVFNLSSNIDPRDRALISEQSRCGANCSSDCNLDTARLAVSVNEGFMPKAPNSPFRI
ncbi:hypothetical protein FRB94_013296 [Tulasnella sp. JGI-2019a]|nr:hypothetical protein FRB94_013296 [Tulasnella sp. JGI-2019a]KAG9008148.1 hypothetical protein FRB93_006715 [Tulasnella sp. JGI-2019a]